MKADYIVCHHSEAYALLQESLKKFGIYVYDDPDFERSSDMAFIISNKKMKKKEVIKFARKQWQPG